MSFAIRRHCTEIHWVLFPKHVARTEPYFCQLSGPTPQVVTPAVQLVIIEGAQQSPPFLALRSSTTGALFPALWLEAAGFDPLLINCQPTDFLRKKPFFFFFVRTQWPVQERLSGWWCHSRWQLLQSCWGWFQEGQRQEAEALAEHVPLDPTDITTGSGEGMCQTVLLL